MCAAVFELFSCYCIVILLENVIEFENAAYSVDEIVGGTQLEIGVRLVAIGQPGPTGNLAVPIMARISTSDITAVALGSGKKVGLVWPLLCT